MQSHSPRCHTGEEIRQLQATRKALGGEKLRFVELDLDILATAYPSEASFLSKENSYPKNFASDNTTPRSGILKPGESARTPFNRFFRTESERDYAKGLIKELVMIHILQGAHGRDAFRKALEETRRRVYLRRNEEPPAVTEKPSCSPHIPDTPYRSPIRPQKTPIPEVSQLSDEEISQSVSSTPSRVKAFVEAIETSMTPGKPNSVAPMPSRTPGSSIKAVVEQLEKVAAANTPKALEKESKTSQNETVSGDTIMDDQSVAQLTPSRLKHQPLVESASTRRSARRKEVGVANSQIRSVSPPEISKRSVRKQKGDESVSSRMSAGVKRPATAIDATSEGKKNRVKIAPVSAESEPELGEDKSSKRNKGQPKNLGDKLPPIPEELVDERNSLSSPVRLPRRAKQAAKEGIIKK